MPKKPTASNQSLQKWLESWSFDIKRYTGKPSIDARWWRREIGRRKRKLDMISQLCALPTERQAKEIAIWNSFFRKFIPASILKGLHFDNPLDEVRQLFDASRNYQISEGSESQNTTHRSIRADLYKQAGIDSAVAEIATSRAKIGSLKAQLDKREARLAVLASSRSKLPDFASLKVQVDQLESSHPELATHPEIVAYKALLAEMEIQESKLASLNDERASLKARQAELESSLPELLDLASMQTKTANSPHGFRLLSEHPRASVRLTSLLDIGLALNWTFPNRPKDLREQQIQTCIFDIAKQNQTHGSNCQLTVDLHAPDEILFSDFKTAISIARKTAGEISRRKKGNSLISRSEMLNWHSSRVLAYFDLKIESLIRSRPLDEEDMKLALFSDIISRVDKITASKTAGKKSVTPRVDEPANLFKTTKNHFNKFMQGGTYSVLVAQALQFVDGDPIF